MKLLLLGNCFGLRSSPYFSRIRRFAIFFTVIPSRNGEMARPFLLSFVKLIANGGELVLGFRFIGSRAKVILPLPREQCVTSVVRSVGRIYISRDDPIFGPSVSFSSPPIFVPSPALSYRKNFFNLALNVQGGISLSFPLSIFGQELNA